MNGTFTLTDLSEGTEPLGRGPRLDSDDECYGDISTVILHGQETTMKRGLPHVLTLLLILCFCNAQTRAPSLSATPTDQKAGVKIQHVSFATEDGGLIYADLYGAGDQCVVLAHGGDSQKRVGNHRRSS